MAQRAKRERTGLLVPPPKKLAYKVRAGRLGGLATAEKMRRQSPDSIKTRSSQGGVAILARYGRDYFKYLRARRRTPNIEQRSALQIPGAV